MPLNELKRDELLVRVLKLKDQLYNGTYSRKNGNWHEGAHHSLNKVLDILCLLYTSDAADE